MQEGRLVKVTYATNGGSSARIASLIPDIEASAVVSVDGLSIASALPQGVEEDRVSAMSAAMLSLGERIASELGRGTLEQVYIKGKKVCRLMSVGEEAVLTAWHVNKQN